MPWVVFAHAVLFIAFWLSNGLFYASTNDFLADMLGQRLDFVRLLVWLSAIVAAWSLVRGILAILGKSHRLAKLTGWLYSITALLYVAFFYGSFWMLFSESPVQLVRIGQLLGYFRLVIDVALLFGLALLMAQLLRGALQGGKLTGRWRYGLLVGAVVVLVLLWCLPLLSPPGNVIRGEVPAKPLLIAHRGASMLAPENTLASASLAESLSVYGVETDIQVSQDGQLFLMHDDTLDRTTNVSILFPGRQDEPASSFSWAELSKLNAGEWFVEQDPYGTLRSGAVTPQQAAEYRQQGVPSLSGWMDIVRAGGLKFIFDLKQPPQGHPYAADFFQLAFDQVHAAGIDPQIWFLASPDQLATLRDAAPAMTAAFGADYQSPPQPVDLLSDGYALLNIEYGISPNLVRQYRDAGLWVNIYTVDEPWQFSRLWLLGVDSVTTSNAGVMAALSRPTFSLDDSRYLLLWSLAGLAGLCLVLGLVLPVVKPGNPI